jgi:putative ABC transport system permease protein
MILCATGLFSLVSLTILKRMKEMGVRKVLGASVLNITRILNAPVVLVLLLASVLGSLLGYLMVDSLMSGIWIYYQTTNVATFVIAIVLMFVISAMTICFKGGGHDEPGKNVENRIDKPA